MGRLRRLGVAAGFPVKQEKIMETHVFPPNFDAEKPLFSLACEKTLTRGEAK
jgi:hypothetical protein